MPLMLAPQHIEKLRKSGVVPHVAEKRGYESTSTKNHLESLGFARTQCHVPALVIPLMDVDGQRAGTQIRPDKPRFDPKRQREIKYEVPKNSQPVIDVPPAVREQVLDSSVPLYITEGAIKADAAASHGLACVSVAGVWTWKLEDPFWTKVPLAGRRIYIVFDSDIATNLSVQKACLKLFEEFKARGADPQVIYLPDLNGDKQGLDDFLACNDKDVLLSFAKSQPPKAPVAINAPETTDSYRTSPSGLVRVVVKDGDEIVVPLTNFNARISGEIEVRDGLDVRHELEITVDLAGTEQVFNVPAEEFERMSWVVPKLGGKAIVHAGFDKRDHARVAIQFVSGAIPKRILFEHLGWVEHEERWMFLHAGGAIGPVTPVPRPESPATANESKSLEHNALNAALPIIPISGPTPNGVGFVVRVPPALQHYRLPEPPVGDELAHVIRETISHILAVAPKHIALSLLAGVFRIAIDRVDYSFHLVGRTNVGKTELAALFTQFFGSELHPRNLPGSWISTSNQVLAVAWHAKNVLFPIDDFVPTGSQSDMDRANRDADRVFRSQGNQAGRGRCNRDGTPREGKPPRCMFISTGEDIPEGHSLNSRILTLEIRPGEILCEDTSHLNTTERRLAENRNKLLGHLQTAARDGLFAKVMAAFIHWLAPQYEEVRASVADQKKGFRDVFQAPGRFARTVDIAADLLAGFNVFLDFCSATGAIDEAGFDRLWEEIHEALETILVQQQREADEREPTKRFLHLLATALTTGWAHLRNAYGSGNGVPEENPKLWGWEERFHTITELDDDKEVATTKSVFVARGQQIGWISGDDVYIEVDAALAVLQRLTKESNLRPLPLSRRTLGKALDAKNLLRSKEKDHFTTKQRIEGSEKRVLHLALDAIMELPMAADQISLMSLLEPE